MNGPSMQFNPMAPRPMGGPQVAYKGAPMPPHMIAGMPPPHMMAQMPPQHMMGQPPRMMGPVHSFAPLPHQGMMGGQGARPMGGPPPQMGTYHPQQIGKPMQQAITVPPQMGYSIPQSIPSRNVGLPPQQRDVPAFEFVQTGVNVPAHLMQPRAVQPSAPASKPRARGNFSVAIVDPNTKQPVVPGADITLSSGDSSPAVHAPSEPSGARVLMPASAPVTIPVAAVGEARPQSPVQFAAMIPELAVQQGSPVRQKSRMNFVSDPPVMALAPDITAVVETRMDEPHLVIVHDVPSTMQEIVESLGTDDDVEQILVGTQMPSSDIAKAVEAASRSLKSTDDVWQEEPVNGAPLAAPTKLAEPKAAVNRFAPKAAVGANRFTPAPTAKADPSTAAPRPKDVRKRFDIKRGEETTEGKKGSLMDAFAITPKQVDVSAEQIPIAPTTPATPVTPPVALEREVSAVSAVSVTSSKKEADVDDEDDWENKGDSDLCFQPRTAFIGCGGCSWGQGVKSSERKEERMRLQYTIATMKKYQAACTTPHPELAGLDDELREEVLEIHREKPPANWRDNMQQPRSPVGQPLSWRQEQRIPEGGPSPTAGTSVVAASATVAASSLPAAGPGIFSQLARSENRWVPKRNVTEDEIVLKKVVGLLNKLTMEKFERLTEELVSIGFNSAAVLKGVISLIFDKALGEQKFSAMYSELCVRLSTRCPEFPDESAAGGPARPITFKRVLLNKCQEEFETAGKITFDHEGLTDEEKEQVLLKRRMKLIGNIKFVGELFKKKMLTEKIMHSCIVHLLKKPEEEEMECLCKLFEGTGKMLDRPEARQYMDKYFERMLALSRDKRFTSRVRFMIQDVIALRRGTWEPRMADNAPQTLNEIRRGG